MNPNRRDLLQRVLAGVAIVPVLNVLTACSKSEEPAPAPAEPAPAAPAEAAPAAPAAPAEGAAPAAAGGMPEGLPALEETDPTAASLGYNQDNTKVDVAKYPKKGEANGAQQKCETCALYQSANNPEWGKCTVFAGKLVKNQGWCNSWSPKQG